MIAETPLFDTSDFDIPDGSVHACVGSDAPFLKAIARQWDRYAHLKSRRGAASFNAEYDKAQMLVARLWGVRADEIGFPASVAEGMSILAESLDWQIGDNVCTDIDEYPSVVGAFALNPKVELRLGEHYDVDRLAELVDDQTRIIAVSHVSYITDTRTDLKALRRLADQVGAMLVVDFTQSAGCLRMDPTLSDFAFAGVYKWMLGVPGTAVAYWNKHRQPAWAARSIGGQSILDRARQPEYSKPLTLRPDADQFTRGNPAYPCIFALTAATDYLLTHDPAAIAQHASALTSRFIDLLRAEDVPFLTPDDSAHRGATVCLDHPSARHIVDQLMLDHILVSHVRGRIRFGFHGYNAMEDVERSARALGRIWRETPVE